MKDNPKTKKREKAGYTSAQWIDRALALQLIEASPDFISAPEAAHIEEDAFEILAHCEGTLQLDGIERLTDRAAKALSDGHRMYMSLNGLKSLEKQSAVFLSQGNMFELQLNGIAEWEEEMAGLFFRSYGIGALCLNGLKRLDSAMASVLLGGPTCRLSLNGVVRLADDFSELKCSHTVPHHSISLDGLAELSAENAQVLVKYTNDLSLNGLTNLPDKVAEVLSKHPGNLSLNKVQNISVAALSELAEIRGSLSLNGLQALSLEQARALSRFGGTKLGLEGVSEPSDEVVEALAGIPENCELKLGITRMSERAVVALVKRKDFLYLDHVVDLDRAAATELCKFQGDQLNLSFLKALQPEIAAILAGYQGHSLMLDGLASLSKEAALLLSGFQGEFISLNGITSLHGGNGEAITCLKVGALGLGGLASLTREEAECLSRFEGEEIYLENLQELTGDAALGLTGMKANISQIWPEKMSEEALEIIAGLSIQINGCPAAEWVSRHSQ